jgi:hypothetical protein
MNSLFPEMENEWQKEWKDMPEFEQKDLEPWQSILVQFESQEDREAFANLIGQNMTYKTKSIWYPEAETANNVNKRYKSDLK